MEVDMTATQAQIDGGKEGRETGLEYEGDFATKINGKTFEERYGSKKIPDTLGTKTKAKTDVFGPNGVKYSVKNPKHTSQGTQIAYHPTAKYQKFHSVPSDVSDAMNFWCGATPELLEELKEKKVRRCPEAWANEVSRRGMNINDFNFVDETRRCRALFKNIPNYQDLLHYFDKNKVKIARFVFSTGMNHPDYSHAWSEKIAWSEKRGSLNGVKIYDIQTIVNKMSSAVVRINDISNDSVIRMGPLTVQQKGSGGRTGYHSLQFNASRNDLDGFLYRGEFQ